MYGFDDYKAYDKEITWFSLIVSPEERWYEKYKKLDNKLYGDILKEVDIHNKKFYTNSIMVDEESDMIAHEKIIYEQQFHDYLNAGIITHCFNAGQPKDNDYRSLGKYFINLCKHTDVRYFTVSNVITHCGKCKKTYVGSKNETNCKYCGNENIEMFQKITGYLTPVNRYNQGKADEFKRRC